MLHIGVIVPAIAKPKETTTITSERMTANNKQRRATFTGNVVLTEGALTVHSDTMVIRFKPQPHDQQERDAAPSPQSRNIDVIVAKGHVKIWKSASRAVSQHAVYYKDEERIVLTGSPVAWQDGTCVSGRKMTMYLRDDRSLVEGGTRVLMQDNMAGASNGALGACQ